MRNNTETSINSYNGHQFVARFLNHIDGVEAKFTKGPREERIIVTYDELTGEMNAKVTSKFDEIKEAVSASAKLCSNLKGEKYSECIADQIAEDVNRISDSKILMQKFRDLTADRLRNYTCADEALQSSTPIGTVHQNVQGQLYRIDELMDTSHAKIWTVDNFIKDEECELLEKHGKPRLRRATVAAEDGSSIISENRKANQAGYDFRGKHEEDPLW